MILVILLFQVCYAWRSSFINLETVDDRLYIVQNKSQVQQLNFTENDYTSYIELDQNDTNDNKSMIFSTKI